MRLLSLLTDSVLPQPSAFCFSFYFFFFFSPHLSTKEGKLLQKLKTHRGHLRPKLHLRQGLPNVFISGIKFKHILASHLTDEQIKQKSSWDSGLQESLPENLFPYFCLSLAMSSLDNRSCEEERPACGSLTSAKVKTFTHRVCKTTKPVQALRRPGDPSPEVSDQLYLVFPQHSADSLMSTDARAPS